MLFRLAKAVLPDSDFCRRLQVHFFQSHCILTGKGQWTWRRLTSRSEFRFHSFPSTLDDLCFGKTNWSKEDTPEMPCHNLKTTCARNKCDCCEVKLQDASSNLFMHFREIFAWIFSWMYPLMYSKWRFEVLPVHILTYVRLLTSDQCTSCVVPMKFGWCALRWNIGQACRRYLG